jgi:hypothetical protein
MIIKRTFAAILKKPKCWKLEILQLLHTLTTVKLH